MVALIAVGPSEVADSGAQSVDRLAASYFAREVETDYYLRSQLGKPIEKLRPISLADAGDDAAFGQRILDGLHGIDAGSLDHDHWLTYRTLAFLASNDVAARKYYWLRQMATPYAGGSQLGAMTTILAQFVVTNTADAERYVSLLHQYAAFIRSIDDLLHGQHQRGIILPNVETDAAQTVFAGFAVPSRRSPLVLDDARLKALDPADRDATRKQIADAIDSEVVPACNAVVAYLEGAYRQGAPSGVGVSQYPGGRDYYQYLILANTTLSTTPQALHETGLREVAHINAELDGVRSQLHFNGNLAQFKHFLATDKQFYVKTPAQFGERLQTYVDRAATAAPSYFLHMPATPYGVSPLPEALAAGQTFGYYDAPTAARKKGLYLYNAWHPERTSALGAGALICHELIPGHHFQIALQQENTALPDVRHYDFSETGFVEGWGEYASQLCWQMGVYRTPYDKSGRLMQDLMVSTRLVVDTGMNAMGWSLERGRAFMRANLVISDAQIASESLRYSTDIPGQALAYKTGELAMLDIRADAEKKLGKAFDMKTFHSWVLDSGSMTLDTLRAHVDYEIQRAKNPSP